MLAETNRSGYRGIVVVDAALIVECDGLSLVDKLVVVQAPEDLRRQRLREHQGLSVVEIEERMAAQLPPEEKSKVADYLIVNDGPRNLLRERVRQVWQNLWDDLARKGGPAADSV